MCCLVYEQQIYRRLKKRLPRAKQNVFLESGPATVLSVDVIGKKLTVITADDQRKLVSLDEIALTEPAKRTAPPKKPEYLWEGAEEPKKKKRRRRRKKKPAGGGGESKQQAKSETSQAAPKKKTSKPAKPKKSQETASTNDGEAKPKKKRRRRRRKKKPSSDSDK